MLDSLLCSVVPAFLTLRGQKAWSRPVQFDGHVDMVLWLCLWLLSPLVCACGLPSKAWGVGLVRFLSGVAFTVFACGSVVSCHSSATRSAANCTSQARKERSGNNISTSS